MTHWLARDGSAFHGVSGGLPGRGARKPLAITSPHARTAGLDASRMTSPRGSRTCGSRMFS